MSSRPKARHAHVEIHGEEPHSGHHSPLGFPVAFAHVYHRTLF
jgi:hypothetical protein